MKPHPPQETPTSQDIPGGVTYRLPLVCGDGHVPETLAVLDALDAHSVRTRFQLFVHHVLRVLPEACVGLAGDLRQANGYDRDRPMGAWHWKGCLLTRKDNGALEATYPIGHTFPEHIPTAERVFPGFCAEFERTLPTFAPAQRLIHRAFYNEGRTREQMQALLEGILPPDVQARLAGDRLAGVLAEPLPMAKDAPKPRL